MVIVRKILVPTDMSEQSLAAIEYASTFGLLYGAKLYLLHVTDYYVPLVPAAHGLSEDAGSLHEAMEGDKAAELNTFLEKNVNPFLGFKPVVRSGAPAEEIAGFAEEEGIDLIVMTTHGWKGLRHVLTGSVAEKVIRISDVPVLTVKSRQVKEEMISNQDVELQLHIGG